MVIFMIEKLHSHSHKFAHSLFEYAARISFRGVKIYNIDIYLYIYYLFIIKVELNKNRKKFLFSLSVLRVRFSNESDCFFSRLPTIKQNKVKIQCYRDCYFTLLELLFWFPSQLKENVKRFEST